MRRHNPSDDHSYYCYDCLPSSALHILLLIIINYNNNNNNADCIKNMLTYDKSQNQETLSEYSI